MDIHNHHFANTHTIPTARHHRYFSRINNPSPPPSANLTSHIPFKPKPIYSTGSIPIQQYIRTSNRPRKTSLPSTLFNSIPISRFPSCVSNVNIVASGMVHDEIWWTSALRKEWIFALLGPLILRIMSRILILERGLFP